MASHAEPVRKLLFVVLLQAVLSLPAFASEPVAGSAPIIQAAESQQNEDDDYETVDEVVDISEIDVPTHASHQGHVGYRMVSTDLYGGRAATYDYLRSGIVGGVSVSSSGKDLKFAVDGSYLNKNDYEGNVLFDYKGIYRFHLRTDAFFHNLDAAQVQVPASIASDGAIPVDGLGIKTEQDLARFRYKFDEYPVHLNLGYWRMVKEGDKPFVFSDVSFSGPGTNSIYSRSRNVDRQTHEGDFSLDAHLGPLDVVYGFVIRSFENLSEVPGDSFVERRNFNNVLLRSAGLQQHDSEPDSRYYAHTVKLHTDLTGGIIGAASYTYGKRENRSSLSTVVGADQSRSTLQNAAGDFTYTPCKEFSLAVKYRRQEIDREIPDILTSIYSVPNQIALRPSLDELKHRVTAVVSIRPSNVLTLKGEYRGEFQHRDNAGMWNLPEESYTHRGLMTLISRPVKGLRLKAQYSYAATASPSYGATADEKHEGQLLAVYNILNHWGLNASYRVTREGNGQTSRAVTSFTSITETYLLPRDKTTSHTALGLWFSPAERLTLNINYGLLRATSDQTVILSSFTLGSQTASNYTSQAQIYAMNAAYSLNDRLDVALGLQHIRSYSEFSPEIKNMGSADTSGIADISRVNTRENSVSARAEYHFSRNLSCSFDYAYRSYDALNASSFEGTVHSMLAQLTTKW